MPCSSLAVAWGAQEVQSEQNKAVREAQLQAEEQAAEAHRLVAQLKEDHHAAVKEAEQAGEARLAEAAKQMQHIKEEHQRAVRAWPAFVIQNVSGQCLSNRSGIPCTWKTFVAWSRCCMMSIT